jgi:hypothetical protein
LLHELYGVCVCAELCMRKMYGQKVA